MKKHKPIYFALDPRLIWRHKLLRAVFLMLNVFALITVLAISFFGGFKNKAYAASYTWDGGGTTNNWSDCVNWSTNVCPVAADTVTFSNTSIKDSVVDASFAGTLTSITIASNYTGTITLARSLTVTNTLSQAGGIFSSGAYALTVNSIFQVTGGTFTAPSTTLSALNIFIISGGTFSHNNGTIIFTGTASAPINCNNATFNRVEFQHTISTKTINSDCILPLGANPTTSTGAITLNGGQLTGSGTLTTGGQLTLSSGATPLVGFTGLVAGGILQTSGTVTADFSNYAVMDLNGGFIVQGTGNFTAPAGTMYVSSQVSIANTATYNANSGTLNLDGGGSTVTCGNAVFSTVTISRPNGSGTTTVGSDCNLPLGNNPTTGGGAIVLNGTLTGTGTLTTIGTAGVLTINSTGSLSGFSALDLASLTLNGPTINLSTLSSLAVKGVFTANTGTNFTAPPTSAFSSAITNNTGATFNAGSGQITVTGGFTNNGTSNLSNGTADFNGTFVLGSGSIFTAPADTMYVASTFTINSGATFNHNNGTVVYDGTGSAVIACGNKAFNLVKFTHTGGGVKTVNSDCSLPLGNNPTIGGDLNADTTLNGTLSGTGVLTVGTAASGNILNLRSTANLSGFTALNAGSVTTSSFSKDFSSYTSFVLNGAYDQTGGSITLPTVTDFNLTFVLRAGASLTASADTMTVASTFTIESGAIFNHNNGTVIFDGSTAILTCNNAVFNFVKIQTTGTKTINAGCSLPLGYDPVVTTHVNLNGSITGTGKLSVTGNVTMSSTAVISGFEGLVVGGIFTSNGATLNLSAYSLADFNNVFTLNTGSVFTAPAGDMTVASTFTLAPDATFNHSNGVVIFDGTGSGAVNCTGTPFNLVKLTYEGSSAKTVGSNCTLLLGTNPIVSGKITVLGTLEGTGTITLNSGTNNLSSPTALSGFTGIFTNGSM